MEEPITNNLKVGDSLCIVLDVDLEKGSGEDSKRTIYGCASDESLDLDEQRISSSAIKKSLDYFLKYGKFDYDHKGKTGPEWIIGQPTQAEIKNKQFYVKGELFKGIKAADDVWNLMKSGAKMGMSVFGKILEMKREFDKSLGREVDKITKLILTGVSITPHPINFNTYVQPWAAVAKSLSNNPSDVDEETIQKALETTPTDTSVSSGKPLIGQSLEKKIHKTTFGDNKQSKNRRKKSMKKTLASGLESLNKGIEDLKDGVTDLEKAISRYDTEDEDDDTKKAKDQDEANAASQDQDTEDEENEDDAGDTGVGDSKKKIFKPDIEDDADDEDELDDDEIEEDEESGGKRKTKADDGKDDIDDEDDDEDDEDEDNEEEATALSKKLIKHKDTGEDDDEDDECSKPAAKSLGRGVKQTLHNVSRKLDDTKRLEKALLRQSETLIEVNRKQTRLIKSLSERVEDLENSPVRERKSVARASFKKSAAEAIGDAMNGEQPDIRELTQQVTEGKANVMDVIKAELGQA